jgi:hypothetical protein
MRRAGGRARVERAHRRALAFGLMNLDLNDRKHFGESTASQQRRSTSDERTSDKYKVLTGTRTLCVQCSSFRKFFQYTSAVSQ